MSDNYFIDTTSMVVGAGGGGPESGTTDAAAYADGGPGGGLPAGGDHARDGTSTGAGGALDAMSGGNDAPDGTSSTGDGAPDVVSTPRDAGRDGAVANVVDSGGTLVFSENFEDDAVGAVPAGWGRVGGSAGDWSVVVDSSQVLAQSKSPSTTLRVCYASASAGRAASVTARVKVTQNGSSGTTTAMLCLRYVVADGSYQCLALEPGVGVQIKTNLGDGPMWPSPISVGAWYGLKLASDDTGLLSAWLQGASLGTFRPAASVSGGSIALATQSAEAEFDDVALSAP
jgi:hypothetical protein